VTHENAALPAAVRKVLDDDARYQVIDSLEVLESEPDRDFDRLTRIAATVFGARFAQINLLAPRRQWSRASFGGLSDIAIDNSFCAHALAQEDDHLVVADLAGDPRFQHNPVVTGAPRLRFYAGAPVVVHGQRIGTLCVQDTTPRAELTADEVSQLVDLAATASSLFALKDEARVRARTAAALIKEEWRHALTLEAGKVGSWVWDVRTGEIACNDMFRRMYELPETGVVLAAHVLEATHPADRAVIEDGINASLENGVDYDAEARVGKSGRWLTMRGRVYQRDAEGKALVMMGACIDVSDTKHNAEHTRHLLRELNHRVKNTLAMIQSVARQTIRQNPDPQGFIDAFSGRLRTISDAHVLLADRDWSGVQLYEVLASQLGKDFIVAPRRASVHGEDVTLPADHALGLGLILHELTTNAHRHGAWSSDVGEVHIGWDVRQEPVRGLSLHWREVGGPTVAMPQEQGLGVRLIERSLAKVLDSDVSLQFSPDGVTAEIWMPLPELAA
jgi:two-component sensor histidine kinase